MLAIQQSEAHQGSYTPNVLPCKIAHNGPVNSTQRYWAPIKVDNGKTMAYFRGRKLQGRTVKIPEGYSGVVVEPTKRKVSQKLQQATNEVGQDEDEIVVEETGVIDEIASFEEVVVWGHDVLADDVVDPYVRGVEEWITFAEKIHFFPVHGVDSAAIKMAKTSMSPRK